MKRSKKILTKIIISYGIMVCVPLLLGIVTYYFTYGVVKEQTEANNSKLINVIQSSCDSEIRYYKSVLEQIKADKTVQELGRSKDHSSAMASWNYYLVKEELMESVSNIHSSNPDCYDLFVWYKGPDKVINYNSSMPWHIYSELVLKENKEWSDDLKQTMNDVKGGEVIRLQDEKSSYILLLEPVIGINIRKGDVVTGIWMDTSGMDMRVDRIDEKKELDWMLVDGNGQILREPQRVAVDEMQTTELLFADGTNRTVQLSGGTYLISVRDSEYYDMKYILFTPENVVNSPAKRIRFLNFVSLFIMLVTGFVTATYFTQMHYHPLKSLLQYFQNKDEKEGSGESARTANEYEYLKYEVSRIVRNNESMQNEHRSMMRSRQLERLLLSRSVENEQEMENEELLDAFRKGRNLVLVCLDKENFALTADGQILIPEKWLRQHVIANVFEEGIGELFRQETFSYADRIVLIIHVPDSREDCTEILQAEVERLQEFIRKHYLFECCVLEGGMHPGLAGIHASWLEACQAESFVQNLESYYIRYDEIRDQAVRDYTYSSEMEACIQAALRNGDANAAGDILDQLIDACYAGSQKRIPELETCMLYDIFATLMKASDEQGIRMEKLSQLNVIATEANRETVKEYFHEIVEDICSRVQEILVSEQGKEMSDEILEYIQIHYSDPDLNISQIAYEYQMTPAWISVAFKKQTGRSLLNVIKQVRIENAKRLLEEGLSVLEVSAQTGFRESSTFIRVFKSSTGVTPGQYKKVTNSEKN